MRSTQREYRAAQLGRLAFWMLVTVSISAVATPSPGADDTETLETSVPSYILERIEIEGNNRTRSRVILREIGLQPGALFSVDDPRIAETRYRLLATGFFHTVDVSLKKGSQRGYAVLAISVQERNTIVVKDLIFGFSEITPYGSVQMAERSLFGSGLELSGGTVVSRDQYALQLGLSDRHIAGTKYGLFVEGYHADARDYFGTSNVLVSDQIYDIDTAIVDYRRSGGRIGTGRALPRSFYVRLSYRLEFIDAKLPAAASHHSFGERRPIEFGHLHRGRSVLSSLILGLTHDTRDSATLISSGRYTALNMEIASGLEGSSYEFTKLTVRHDEYFTLPHRQVILLSGFLGYITGDAPFFNQFFVGDFSSFIPSRVLELNFSQLQPSVLNTSVQEMRYEDLAASIGVEYAMPVYRGSGFVYGIDAYVGTGVYALASREDLRVDPQGYQGARTVPFDLTADIGVRIDTEYGMFIFSMATLFRWIPGLKEGTAE